MLANIHTLGPQKVPQAVAGREGGVPPSWFVNPPQDFGSELYCRLLQRPWRGRLYFNQQLVHARQQFFCPQVAQRYIPGDTSSLDRFLLECDGLSLMARRGISIAGTILSGAVGANECHKRLLQRFIDENQVCCGGGEVHLIAMTLDLDGQSLKRRCEML